MYPPNKDYKPSIIKKEMENTFISEDKAVFTLKIMNSYLEEKSNF